MASRTLAALMSLCAVLTLGTSAPEAARSSARSSGRTLIFSDDFGGPAGALPRGSRWTPATGGGGWGNGELQCYTSSTRNAATNGKGQLVITARREPGHRCADGRTNDFTSARLSTRSTLTVTHGRLEVRAQLPPGAGTWPAFWAIGADDVSVGWPRCGELDVVEYTGSKPKTTTSAAHFAAYDGTHSYLTRTARPARTLATAFHVYALDWTADTLTFTRDGVVTGRITRAEVLQHGPWLFDKPFYLLLNLAMGGSYAGRVPASTTAAQRYVIDYVRVYH